MPNKDVHQSTRTDAYSSTSGPADNTSKSVNIGEAAHITAASPGGARYDASLTPEQRRDAENGIWMCRTHAALIDRDEVRFPAHLVTDWKYAAEERARKLLGRPHGCANGNLASVSPAVRFGAEATVIVDDEYLPIAYLFDADADNSKLSWFVNAMVIQFSIQKNHILKNAILNHLIVTVHETKRIPDYKPWMGVYPAETNLFYVEIAPNCGTMPREFRPSRYYYHATEHEPERRDFPPALVLDDDIPAQIALRLNAESSGMYHVSVDASVSAGTEREVLLVMPPQWMIFEQCADDYDPEFGA